MSLNPSNPDGMLGRLVYIMRSVKTHGGTVKMQEMGMMLESVAMYHQGTVVHRARSIGIRIPGIEWRIVELDRQRGTIVLRSVTYGTRSECRLEWFMRQGREGTLELE